MQKQNVTVKCRLSPTNISHRDTQSETMINSELNITQISPHINLQGIPETIMKMYPHLNKYKGLSSDNFQVVMIMSRENLTVISFPLVKNFVSQKTRLKSNSVPVIFFFENCTFLIAICSSTQIRPLPTAFQTHEAEAPPKSTYIFISCLRH